LQLRLLLAHNFSHQLHLVAAVRILRDSYADVWPRLALRLFLHLLPLPCLYLLVANLIEQLATSCVLQDFHRCIGHPTVQHLLHLACLAPHFFLQLRLLLAHNFSHQLHLVAAVRILRDSYADVWPRLALRLFLHLLPLPCLYLLVANLIEQLAKRPHQLHMVAIHYILQNFHVYILRSQLMRSVVRLLHRISRYSLMHLRLLFANHFIEQTSNELNWIALRLFPSLYLQRSRGLPCVCVAGHAFSGGEVLVNLLGHEWLRLQLQLLRERHSL